MQFVEETKSFEMFSLSFPLKKDEQGKIIRPEKNPATCLKCHGDSKGQNPMILWGNYGAWTGVYGNSPKDTHDKLTAEEETNLLAYVRTSSHLPPYNKLIVDPTNPTHPYLPENASWSYWKYRPNTKLGAIASHLNAKTIANRIIGTPLVERHKRLMTMKYYNCDQIFSTKKASKQEIKGLLFDLSKSSHSNAKSVAKKIKNAANISYVYTRKSELSQAIDEAFEILLGLPPGMIRYSDGSELNHRSGIGSFKGILLNFILQDWIKKDQPGMLAYHRPRSWIEALGIGDEPVDGVLQMLHQQEDIRYVYGWDRYGMCPYLDAIK